ncbi:MAG: hypothetical protein H0W15_10105 [Gemmatimonadales bacterium]|nr:hypothetical protein [Gemmatimonadales bacterium]
MTRKLLCTLFAVTTLAGCAALQQVGALRQVAFALSGIRGGRLAGVDLSRISAPGGLSALEIGRITVAVARRDLPLELQADVRAENPVDNKLTATMVRLAWTLYLNDKETISGVVDTSLTLPPGEPRIIPVKMRLNLLQFFDGPAESMVDLAIAVAGLNVDPTKITIRAIPTINTRYGPITYPAPITIVSQTVGGPVSR